MLAEAFVDLADTLVADFDVVDLSQRLVEDCVSLLAASAAGLLLIDQRGGLRVLASTSEETRLLELFQVQVDRGPCLDCIHRGRRCWCPTWSSPSADGRCSSRRRCRGASARCMPYRCGCDPTSLVP
jgi:hypothetical protein